MPYGRKIQLELEAQREMERVRSEMVAQVKEQQDLVDKISSLRVDRERLQKEIDGLSREKVEMRERVESLCKELEDLKRQGAVEMLKKIELAQELRAIQSSHAGEDRTYRKNIVEYQEKVDELEKRYAALQSNVNGKRKALEVIKKRLENWSGRVSELRSYEDSLTQKEAALSARKQEIEDKDNTIKRLTKEVNTLRGDISILKQRNGKREA